MCEFLGKRVSKLQPEGHIQSALCFVSKDFLKTAMLNHRLSVAAFCATTAGPSRSNTDHCRVCACSTLLSFGWIFQFILHQQHTLRVPWLTLKIPKAPSLAVFTYPTLFPHTTPGNFIRFRSFNKCLYANGSPSLNM